MKQLEREAQSEEMVDVINRQYKQLKERDAKIEKVQGDAYGMINCLQNQLHENDRYARELEDTLRRLNIIHAAKGYLSGTATRQMNELENKVHKMETVETELHCSIKKLHKHLLNRNNAQKEEESAICGEVESAIYGEEESANCG